MDITSWETVIIIYKCNSDRH